MNIETFSIESLKINLFFLRIMKEHALFIMLSLPAKEKDLQNEATLFIESFDSLLATTINLSTGYLSYNDIYITNYTKNAEDKTSNLTGVMINTTLTTDEEKLVHTTKTNYETIAPLVIKLNGDILFHLNRFIEFKTKILNLVNKCVIFSFNYPSLLEHIKNEAIMYAQILINIQEKLNPKNKLYDIIRQESFWDHIIAQHGQFMSGFLDPSEKELIEIAQEITIRFNILKNKISNAKSKPEIKAITNESIPATKEVISYNELATKNILNCNIKSIIIPLMSDHLLREASFYLDLLEELNQEIR